jgi:hypothetical protein
MNITPSQIARLEFLTRVTGKECQHFLIHSAANP